MDDKISAATSVREATPGTLAQKPELPQLRVFYVVISSYTIPFAKQGTAHPRIDSLSKVGNALCPSPVLRSEGIKLYPLSCLKPPTTMTFLPEMDPVTAFATGASVCAIAIDALLLHRQRTVGPWYLDAQKQDVESSCTGNATTPPTSENPEIPQDPTPHESSPLISSSAPSYDAPTIEKAEASNPVPPATSQSEWPPSNAPRWLFGLKRSQYFLSPAERPPIFGHWYSYFKLLWPPLIVQEFLTPRPNPNLRKLHPQAGKSILLCFNPIMFKLLLPSLLYLESQPDPSLFLKVVGVAEAWLLIVWMLCDSGIYWKSQGYGSVSGGTMARLRMMLWISMVIGIWVGAWVARDWAWHDFWTLGLPFAILVGMSYGLAWER